MSKEIADILDNPDDHSKEDIIAILRELIAVKDSNVVQGPRKRGKMEGIITGNLNDTEYLFHPKVEEKLTEIADLPIMMLDKLLQGLFGTIDQVTGKELP